MFCPQGLGKGYEVPLAGKMTMAPCTVARVQLLCACHQRVPSSDVKVTF